MLLDLTPFDLTGKEVENLLDGANITANKNTIPNDPKSAFVTSGVRIGTPAVTARGLKEEDMETIAEAVALMIKEGESATEKAKTLVKSLTDKYPLDNVKIQRKQCVPPEPDSGFPGVFDGPDLGKLRIN